MAPCAPSSPGKAATERTITHHAPCLPWVGGGAGRGGALVGDSNPGKAGDDFSQGTTGGGLPRAWGDELKSIPVQPKSSFTSLPLRTIITGRPVGVWYSFV